MTKSKNIVKTREKGWSLVKCAKCGKKEYVRLICGKCKDDNRQIAIPYIATMTPHFCPKSIGGDL